MSVNTNIVASVPFSAESLASESLLVTLGSVRRFSTGTLGPVAFGLGLRDSCLVILFFNLISAIPPAYL